MKIHILYKIKKGPWGGGNQFIKALKLFFVKNGVYENDPFKADIIFINQYPFKNEKIFFLLYKLKKTGKKMVHRIDGPIYLHKKNYLMLDKLQYQFNHLFCEGTIFQSNYSERNNKKLGMKKNNLEKIIYNAPDKYIFNRNYNKKKNEKIRMGITSWSGHINKGFDVYEWMDKNMDFNKYEIIFIGNSIIKFKNIRDLGPMNTEKLAKNLKTCDIYITASRNEACSNSLLEALHLGLPTISLKSGSNPELIKKGGEYFQDPKEIPAIADKIMKNYQKYVDNIDVKDINNIGVDYLEFIRTIYNSGYSKKVNIMLFLRFITLVYCYKFLLKTKNMAAIFYFPLNRKILKNRRNFQN